MNWPAFFQDGRTSYAAKVSLSGNDLILSDDSNRPRAFWKLDQLVPVKNTRSELVLTQRGQPGQLSLRGAAVTGLRRELEQTSAWRDVKTRNRGGRLARLLPLAALAAAIWFFWPQIVNWGMKALPLAAEDYIGRQMHDRLIAGQNVCTASPGRDILNRLLTRLAGNNEAPLQVTVLDDAPASMSLLLPGRRLVLSRLMLTGEYASPDQFAAALAYDMALADTRAPVRQAVAAVPRFAASTEWSAAHVANRIRLLLPRAHTRLHTGTPHDDATSLRILTDAQIGSAGLIALLRSQSSEALTQRAAALVETTGQPVLSAKNWFLLRTICNDDSR